MGPTLLLAFRIHRRNIPPGQVGISTRPKSASTIKNVDRAQKDQTSPNMPDVWWSVTLAVVKERPEGELSKNQTYYVWLAFILWQPVDSIGVAL